MVVPGDLFTSAELLAIYDPESSKRVTANGLSRELRRSGVERANNGQPIRGPNGLDRFYIIRNSDKWSTCEHKELAEQLNKQYNVKPDKKKSKY